MDVFSELNTGISDLKDNVYLFMCVFSALLHQLGLIARKDKKAFLSDWCKEIEENNRMGKIRDLFKKIRDNKGTFHPKMGSIKDRNGMDLTEAEDIKRGGKNTQKNYIKKRSS